MSNSLWRLVWCVPSMATHSICSQTMSGLAILVHHVTLPLMKDSCMTSLTSTNGFKVAPVLCLLWKRASYGWHKWTRTGPYTMACEILSFGRCKSSLAQISSDDANNIVVITPIGNIILDCQIKTHDGWVAGVNFSRNAINKKAGTATALIKRDINDLHVELGHSSEAIMRSSAKNFGIQVTGMFRPCEDCTSGKAKQWVGSKKAVPLGKSFYSRWAPHLLQLMAVSAIGC